MSSIRKYDDVIDSRDVIARIEELQDAQHDLAREVEDSQQSVEIATGDDEQAEAEERLERAESDLSTWEEENLEELEALLSLQEDASGSPDWEYGETLIRDSYFQDYAQELAEDAGMTPDNLQWPMTCIDWEQAARELKMDYFSVEFDGVTFWIRA